LNPPAEPAGPNALYFGRPDEDSPVEFLLTDQDGYLLSVGNSLFVQGVAKTGVAPILLSSTAINLNEGTAAKQALYTVPASRRAIVTRIDLDKLSDDPVDAAFTMGWNAGATNTLDPFLLSDLVTSSAKFGSILVQPTSWLVGTAAQVLGLAVSTPQGSALAARVNVFGYLTDADGLPVANIL